MHSVAKMWTHFPHALHWKIVLGQTPMRCVCDVRISKEYGDIDLVPFEILKGHNTRAIETASQRYICCKRDMVVTVRLHNNHMVLIKAHHLLSNRG